MSAYVEDTIAAIATASGPGAISVVRVSGRDARTVAARVLLSPDRDTIRVTERLGQSHRASVLRVVDPDDRTSIDDVLVLPMLAPRSFTGEDVVEIHSHGGRTIPHLVLGALLRAGARSARAGEFTERAFLNGRLDLCQAEAIADLIEATSAAAAGNARRQLEGHLSRAIEDLRESILDARARVEAQLDFPEDDLPPDLQGAIERDLDRIAERVSELASTYGRGRLVREGVRVVLAGKPNVGKSSLMNALLGRARALVSDQPGTTRDYLEEPLGIAGLAVLLSDTAGLRSAPGEVEREGIDRTRERIRAADIVAVVLDGSAALDREDQAVLEETRAARSRILVRNKIDLAPAWSWRSESASGALEVDVSCVTGAGLEDLCRAIAGALPEGTVESSARETPLITNARHHAALLAAGAALGGAREQLRGGHPLEIVASDLQMAAGELEGILGVMDGEAVLDRVFSRFCIGK